MMFKVRDILIPLLILKAIIFAPFFICAEETPTIAIEKAKFFIEQVQQAGTEKVAWTDLAAAKSWLAAAQKQYEEARSSGRWMTTEKMRRIKEEGVIYLATMAKIKALIAENKIKKERISKKLQLTLEELNDQRNRLELVKRDLREAEKNREFQGKIEAEKRALEEVKRQIANLEQEKKLVAAEALSKVREVELRKQQELDEMSWKENQRAVEREKELTEVKIKAEELAFKVEELTFKVEELIFKVGELVKEKLKEEAEKKTLEAEKKTLAEKLTLFQEKATSLEQEKSLFLAAHKISGAIIKLTEREIVFNILAINLFTPSMEIKADGKEILDQVGSFLNTYPDYQVIVRGHTDSVGNPALNQALSERRAQKVREYLVAYQNIIPTRIIAEGVGPSQPVASNDTEAGRILNRRVEIILIVGK